MELTNVLKAISDETRMNIIKLLLEHDYCVRGLAKKLGISESAVSQHIKIMRENNILVPEKRGYFIHYKANKAVLLEVAKKLTGLAEGGNCISRAKEGKCKKECC
ncbi:ArsR/SmtB family transcription factor [Cellulosilyticum ruminicola]|uniref:ArsR/SmtB family transcription factor n=1 Tax=Cellulosilyticum ruminicola TaxID=425254 RepID=UPI0006D28411|nr:metalloregulator ArsR/SmtB family transcription factor [Cellulosilyticum ruminicola]